MKTLTIRLTAPLQSYGNAQAFNYRTTKLSPTKSAVIGMIAAALGYRRNDHRISELNQLLFAVRVDQPGKMLNDFHIVEWKKNKRKITHRYYLQDAVFIVAIGSPDKQLIKQIQNALKRPKFQLALGRRANAPAGPLQMKLDEFPQLDPVETLEKMSWQAAPFAKLAQKRKAKQAQNLKLEVISDAALMPDRPVTMVKDQVISFDQRDRQFDYRPEASKFIALKNPYFKPTKPESKRKQNSETTQDVMASLEKRDWSYVLIQSWNWHA